MERMERIVKKKGNCPKMGAWIEDSKEHRWRGWRG
jgi:hypothetical protein